jgi:beta-galactosidase
MSGTGGPELRIDGYVHDRRVISRSFSSDHSFDRLFAEVDDRELRCDGSDATRLVFGVVDKFSTPRAFGGGNVSLAIEGPGVIIGDNPFQLTDAGGMGAVWIRSIFGQTGWIRLTARHGSLGTVSSRILVSKSGDERAD